VCFARGPRQFWVLRCYSAHHHLCTSVLSSMHVLRAVCFAGPRRQSWGLHYYSAHHHLCSGHRGLIFFASVCFQLLLTLTWLLSPAYRPCLPGLPARCCFLFPPAGVCKFVLLVMWFCAVGLMELMHFFVCVCVCAAAWAAWCKPLCVPCYVLPLTTSDLLSCCHSFHLGGNRMWCSCP